MQQIPDTTSLRPQGFYAYAFLAARAGCVVALGGIVGLVSHFIVIITHAEGDKDKLTVPPVLLATLVIVRSPRSSRCLHTTPP